MIAFFSFFLVDFTFLMLSPILLGLSQIISTLRLSAEEEANVTIRTFLRYVINEMSPSLNTVSMGLSVLGHEMQQSEHSLFLIPSTRRSHLSSLPPLSLSHLPRSLSSTISPTSHLYHLSSLLSYPQSPAAKDCSSSSDAMAMVDRATDFMSDTLDDVMTMHQIEEGTSVVSGTRTRCSAVYTIHHLLLLVLLLSSFLVLRHLNSRRFYPSHHHPTHMLFLSFTITHPSPSHILLPHTFFTLTRPLTVV